MPEISRFFGIVIAMFYNDHSPPHFHARYGSEERLLQYKTSGSWKLPRRAMDMVTEWATRHRFELAENWSARGSASH